MEDEIVIEPQPIPVGEEPDFAAAARELYSPVELLSASVYEAAAKRTSDVYAMQRAIVWDSTKKALERYVEESDPTYQQWVRDYEQFTIEQQEAVDERLDRFMRSASYSLASDNISNAAASGELDSMQTAQAIRGAAGELTPSEIAYNANVGYVNPQEEGYTPPLMEYNLDFLQAMESVGWDFDKGEGLSNLGYNLLGRPMTALETAFDLLAPFSTPIDWYKFDFGPLDMREYQKMTVKEQKEVRKRVMAELSNKQASKFEAVAVMGLLDPTASWALEFGFGLADIVGSLFGIGGAISKTKNAYRLRVIERVINLQKERKAPAMFKGLGDHDSAATTIARVLVGQGSEAKAAKMTKEEALLAMAPFDYTPLAPSVVEGLSSRAVRKLEKYRKLQYYEMLRSFNSLNSPTSGFLREAERAIAFERISASLPEFAEVVEKTPFGVRIKVRFADRFETEEELLAAKKDYEDSITTYERISNELDAVWEGLNIESTAVGKGLQDGDVPSLPEQLVSTINKMEAEKALAKAEMERLDKVLTVGMKGPASEERFVFYQIADDVGKFTGDVTSDAGVVGELVGRATLSPDVYLSRIDQALVSERSEIIGKQAALLDAFRGAAREVYNITGKNDKIAKVLLHGDETEQVFTPRQLNEGIDIPNVGTVRLSTKEIGTYLKYRDLADGAHRMRSTMMFRELGGKGYKQAVTQINGVSRKIFVKAIDAFPSEVTRFWDDTAIGGARVAEVNDRMLKSLKTRVEKGDVSIVRLEKRIKVDNAADSPRDYINYAVIKNDKIKDLTPDVLPKATGYVTRDYADVPYIVRAVRQVLVDGKKDEIKETIRFFSRRDEAEAFAAKETVKTGRKHIADLDENWRTSDPGIAAELNEAVFAGRYQDERGELLKIGENADTAPRRDPFASMERYLSNLSWAYPLNEFRLSVVQRFENSFGDMIRHKNDWMKKEPDFVDGLSENQRNNFLKARDYVLSSINVTTHDERLFSRAVKSAAEQLEKVSHGGILDKARLKIIYGVDDVDALGYLRRATYYNLLAGNPSQLLVQASNAAQIFAANPQNAYKVLPRLLATRVAAFMNPTDPNWDKAMNVLAVSALMKPADFKDMMLAAHRSGFFYTALNNADMAVAMRGIGPGGMMGDMGRLMKRVYESPYVEGELLSRSYGWIDAYTRIKAKEKKARGLSKFSDNPDEISKVVAEAFRVGYNYTQANRAYWQKQPILATATQFLSPVAKFYENVLLPFVPGVKYKGRFTTRERATIVLFQPILYGAMGVPFYNTMKEGIASAWESITGKSKEDFTDTERQAIVGGLTDVLGSMVVSSITGDENPNPQIASRVSLANLSSIFTKFDPAQTSSWELILGPSAVMPQRMAKAIEMVAPVVHGGYTAGTLDVDDIYTSMGIMATSVSGGWNNYMKARLWESTGFMMSNKYGYRYKLDPNDPRSITWLRSLGFSSWEEASLNEMENYMMEHNPDTIVRDTLNALDVLAMQYFQNVDLRNPKEYEKYSLAVDAIIGSVRTTDGSPELNLQDKIRKEYAARIMDKDTKVRAMAEQFINNNLELIENVEPPVTWGFVKPDYIVPPPK